MSVNAVATPMRHAAYFTRKRSEVMAYWCIGPALFLIILTTLAPLGAVALFSLTNYELGARTFDWVGLGNFAKAFQDPLVLRSVSNTLVFTAMVVPAAVGLGLLFALLVNGRRRTRRIYELLLFLPITAVMAVMALVWGFALHEQIGPVNAIIQSLGFQRIGFFSDPDVVLVTLAFIAAWQHTCFCFIIFIAGLTAIPQDLYEAAELDGADRGWERFRRVTWPQLAPTTLVVVLLTTIRAFQVFDLVVVLTQGTPSGRSDVILYTTYLEAYSYFRVGYGSALTLIFVAMVSLVTFVQFWLARRRNVA